MHEIYELKEMLMNELKEYGKKGEMSAGTLDIVDKLSHAVKNLCKIIEDMEGSDSSYENRDYSRTYRRSDSPYVYARGRNARRDSMGRYSREEYSQAMDDMTQELRELMKDAPDEQTRKEFQKFIQKIEQM